MPVRTIFFDVDQTLVDKKGNLFPKVAEILKELYDYGFNLFAWSGSGHRHTRRMLERHKLLQYFKFKAPIEYACFDKPDVIVDDCPERITGSATVVKIDKPEDWNDFYSKFYGKAVF